MKRLISFLIFSLAALPGCGTKEKKDQLETTSQPLPAPDTVFHYAESPDDTTLPTKIKTRASFLEETKEAAQSEDSK